MKKAPVQKSDQPSPAVAPAFYEGKEEWKAGPGNRYTPEELEAMDQNWDVRLSKPRLTKVLRAD
jgi:hypothetical protein